MQESRSTVPAVTKRPPWNKGKLTGAKPPLRLKHAGRFAQSCKSMGEPVIYSAEAPLVWQEIGPQSSPSIELFQAGILLTLTWIKSLNSTRPLK